MIRLNNYGQRIETEALRLHGDFDISEWDEAFEWDMLGKWAGMTRADGVDIFRDVQRPEDEHRVRLLGVNQFGTHLVIAWEVFEECGPSVGAWIASDKIDRWTAEEFEIIFEHA